MNDTNAKHARRIVLSGIVQGVGFRPFIYRHAILHKLHGWVRNSSGRVEIHVQGDLQSLDRFSDTLIDSAPDLSRPVLESVCSKPLADEMSQLLHCVKNRSPH